MNTVNGHLANTRVTRKLPRYRYVSQSIHNNINVIFKRLTLHIQFYTLYKATKLITTSLAGSMINSFTLMISVIMGNSIALTDNLFTGQCNTMKYVGGGLISHYFHSTRVHWQKPLHTVSEIPYDCRIRFRQKLTPQHEISHC